MKKTNENTQPWSMDVLNFWFSELSPKNWYMSSKGLDTTIITRFQEVHTLVAQHNDLAEHATKEQALASVIVLDQFSRNMFRATKQAFAYDEQALRLSKQAIDRDLHATMNKDQKQFLFMPFMHAENAEDQATAVALFTALNMGKHAEEHKVIVDQFGRFPHRNEALGRISTEAELTYLKDGKRFGQ